MSRLLTKCFLRAFRENCIRYIVQILLVAVAAAVIIAIESTAFTIIEGRQDNSGYECIEDGQFTALFPVSDDDINRLSSDFDVEIQKNYSADISEGGNTYRFFEQREKIDMLVLRTGKAPAEDSEIVIEQNYAEHYGMKCGDTVTIGGKRYTVSGTGALPDYVNSVKNQGDASPAAYDFTWVIADDGEFERCSDDSDFSMTYTYAYLSGEDTDVEAFSRAVHDLEAEDVYLLGMEGDTPDILNFTEREDNPRMDNDLDYAYLYRTAGFIIGIILISMLAFIFAVVTRNQVHNDHGMIGSLYALGIRKRSIMALYVLPSVVLSFAGGIIGLFAGYLPVLTDISMGAFHNVNSFPYYAISHPLILFIYALVMPPAVSLVMNFAVLNRSLSHSALSLMRGSFETKKNPKIKLNRFGFIRRFQIRQLIKERGSIIVFASVLTSLIILMLGLSTDAMIDNNVDAVKNHVRYEYLCSLKYPMKDFDTDGEKLLIKSVRSQYSGKNISFSLIGLPEESEYYAAEPQADRKTAVAGRALATKFNLKTGDCISFCEDAAGDEHTVEITDIVDSGSGLELYMDESCVHDMLDIKEGCCNAVAFGSEPDIDEDLICSTVSKEEILKNVEMIRVSVTPFKWFAFISSIVIFIITLYLVVSTLIDRSEFGMSLLRVMGYDSWEIQRLYVNPVIYSVASALIFAIPAAKLLCDCFCPYIYIDMAIGMFYEMSFGKYLLVFAVGMILFFGILLALIRKVKRIDTSIVLKCRE